MANITGAMVDSTEFEFGLDGCNNWCRDCSSSGEIEVVNILVDDGHETALAKENK